MPTDDAAPATTGAVARASVTAVAAAAVATAGYLGALGIGAVVLLLALVFAAGWPKLLGLPTAHGGSIVIAASAIAAFGVVRLRSFSDLAMVIALAVIAAVIHQMLRRDGRPRLVESLSGIVTGAVVVISASGWAATETDGELVVLAAATITGAALVTSLPLKAGLTGLLAAVVGSLIGAGAGFAFDDIGWLPGLVIGLATGILTAACHVLYGRFPGAGHGRAALAAGLVLVLVPGIPVYLVGELLDGRFGGLFG